MTKIELETIIDKIIAGVTAYDVAKDDEDVFYVEVLDNIEEIKSHPQIYDETLGIKEKEFAQELFNYPGLENKLIQLAEFFIEEEFAFLYPNDQVELAGFVFVTELAKHDIKYIDLFCRMLAAIPLNFHDYQVLWNEINAVIEKWGKNPITYTIVETLLNEVMVDEDEMIEIIEDKYSDPNRWENV